jgi:hypothetical protein
MGLNPMPFIKQMNRGQEKTHHDESQEEGLGPWLHFVASQVNEIIRMKFGFNDIVFQWKEAEETDEAARAVIEASQVQNKIYHPDEIRQRRGDEPMPPNLRAQMDLATFSAAVNSTILPPDQQAAQDKSAQALAAARPAPVIGHPAGGTGAPGGASGGSGGPAAKLGKAHRGSTHSRSTAPLY